jgi:hypothetical protein
MVTSITESGTHEAYWHDRSLERFGGALFDGTIIFWGK